MAQASRGGSNILIAVLVGALATAVAVIGWLVYSAAHTTPEIRPRPGIDLSLPRSPAPEGPQMPPPLIPKPQ
jgi:hypothetical protein